MIKRISALAVVAAVALSAAACSSHDKRYAAWGGGGAAVGALAGQAIGHDTKGTLIGAGVGAAAGSLIAHHKNKKADERANKAKGCTYRDSQGRTYTAACTQ